MPWSVAAGSTIASVRELNTAVPSGFVNQHLEYTHGYGAVLAPIENTWAVDGSFRPVDELRDLYASLGFSADKEIITYCAVGGRASQAWFVLTYLLGYPCRREEAKA